MVGSNQRPQKRRSEPSLNHPWTNLEPSLNHPWTILASLAFCVFFCCVLQNNDNVEKNEDIFWWDGYFHIWNIWNIVRQRLLHYFLNILWTRQRHLLHSKKKQLIFEFRMSKVKNIFIPLVKCLQKIFILIFIANYRESIKTCAFKRFGQYFLNIL